MLIDMLVSRIQTSRLELRQEKFTLYSDIFERYLDSDFSELFNRDRENWVNEDGYDDGNGNHEADQWSDEQVNFVMMVMALKR